MNQNEIHHKTGPSYCLRTVRSKSAGLMAQGLSCFKRSAPLMYQWHGAQVLNMHIMFNIPTGEPFNLCGSPPQTASRLS